MSIEGGMTGIFVYGLELNSDGSLGQGTKDRALLALELHRYMPNSIIVAAAGISPDVPSQTVPMHTLIAEFLATYQVAPVYEIPAVTFDTLGERGAFLSLGVSRKMHVTSWWHMPRVWLGRRSVKSLSPIRTITYAAVWDRPTLRSAGLEVAKLCSILLLPKSLQNRVARLVKSRVRTSW